ncbi:UNVERIFIED_CONTAM: hypothetical protein RMT77_005278 [Armadillidium vulgare]
MCITRNLFRTMKKSSFYQLFILLCLFANISRGNKVSQRNVDFSSPDCKTIVCEQAHEQAKGLSQLALLDEFVSQTVLLLRDLMKTMDGEIEKSAKSLLRYIHPHCTSTQRILEEVIEKQSEKIEVAPFLGEGIKPMEEDEQEKDEQSIQTGGGQDNYNYIIDERAGTSQNNKWSKYDSKNDDVQESVSDYDDSVYENKSEENQFSGRGWTGQWVGIEKSKEQESQKWKNSQNWSSKTGGETRLSHRSREGKSVHKPEVLDSSENDLGFKICKGVNKGSAFWVPGIDQWCQENCSKGYCPKTHCIC